MLDELTLAYMPKPAAPQDQLHQTGLRITDPVTDSINRLEPALIRAAMARLNDAVNLLEPSQSYAWLSEPWQHLDKLVATSRLAIDALPLSGTSYVIGITNPTAQSHSYTLALDKQQTKQTTISQLRPVLAADGRLAFDALEETAAANIKIASNDIVYLLIEEAPGASTGDRHHQITDDTGWMQELTVTLTVYDAIRPTTADQPHALVWTYTRDQPIWKPENETTTVARLSEAGINVFEVHPADLPQPFAEDQWNIRVTALRKHLKLYHKRGLLLLFLGSSGWQKLSTMDNDELTRRRLKDWLLLLVEELQNAGYDSHDWALYLIDEPHGTSLDELRKAIEILRDIEPSLRFYANPIRDGGLDLRAGFLLRTLKSRIDYWQPLAGEAYTRVQQAIGTGQSTELWLYVIPPQPARSALPACYRDIGRMAFDRGASGLGFWSFSDVGGSSAWSDFDGRRPDWAVVYEGKDGFITGRRWEAFKVGIKDYAALRYCARIGDTDTRSSEQCRRYRMALESKRPNCRGWW
jgi:hypothetical protein